LGSLGLDEEGLPPLFLKGIGLLVGGREGIIDMLESEMAMDVLSWAKEGVPAERGSS